MNERVSISFIGDLLCWAEQIELAYSSDTNQYNFDESFNCVKKYFQNSDYVVGNLETTVSGATAGYTSNSSSQFKRTMFNAPDEFAISIKNAGVDFVSTSNNHCLDRDIAGLIQTIHTLDKIGLEHTGTYLTKEESEGVFIKEIRGIKFAFITCTYGVNYSTHGMALPDEKNWMVNTVSRSKIYTSYNDYQYFRDDDLSIIEKISYRLTGFTKAKKDRIFLERILAKIDKAKSFGVDHIIVLSHIGPEFQRYPSGFAMNLINKFINHGADIIISNHPHVLQPMGCRKIKQKNGTVKNCFIIYSMGNFLAAPVWGPPERTQKSLILNLDFRRNDNGISKLNEISFVPTYIQHMNKDGQRCIRTVSVYDALMNKTVSSSIPDEELTILRNYESVLQELCGVRKLKYDLSEKYHFKPENLRFSYKFYWADFIQNLKYFVYSAFWLLPISTLSIIKKFILRK